MLALFSWSRSAGRRRIRADRARRRRRVAGQVELQPFQSDPRRPVARPVHRRPPKANLPCTVDPGHFQYESDVFNWTRSVSGGATTDTFLYTNPTLKVGLTNTIDLEANMAPLERVVTRSASGQQGFEGVGDLYVRGKFNLAGPDGGDFQLAVIPYVKARRVRRASATGRRKADSSRRFPSRCRKVSRCCSIRVRHAAQRQ